MSEIKEPIAQRKLTAGTTVITVTVGRPQRSGDDYSCPYCIEFGNAKRIGHAIGMDGVQAIQLAMRKIGVDLLATGSELGSAVSWLDVPGETGFPT